MFWTNNKRPILRVMNHQLPRKARFKKKNAKFCKLMGEPGLLWLTWHPRPEGITSKWTIHSQRQTANLKRNPTCDYQFGALRTFCLQVFSFSYKNSCLLFHFRKFKLIVILKSKCSTSGRPCEGQKTAPVRGQFLFIAETAPLQPQVLPEQNCVLGSFSLSFECRGEGSFTGSSMVKKSKS